MTHSIFGGCTVDGPEILHDTAVVKAVIIVIQNKFN